MNKDRLIIFHRSMMGFDPNEIILVRYNDLLNTLTYYQPGKTVIATWINCLYLPREFKYGILTPEGYQRLLDDINSIIKENLFDDDTLVTNLEKLGISFYTTPVTSNGFNPGPQLRYQLKFVTFTNRLVVWYSLRFFSRKSRILLRWLKIDKKARDKNEETLSEKSGIHPSAQEIVIKTENKE